MRCDRLGVGLKLFLHRPRQKVFQRFAGISSEKSACGKLCFLTEVCLTGLLPNHGQTEGDVACFKWAITLKPFGTRE